jgi:hypothetical protein
MCGQYEDFKTYFVGQKSELIKKDKKLTVPIRKQSTTNPPTTEPIDKEQLWEPEGLYKDWFGFKIDEEKEIEFKKNDNPKFGLKPFQTKYKIQKAKKHKYEDTFKVKTKCVAITSTKTHAAGLWKIEAYKD